MAAKVFKVVLLLLAFTIGTSLSAMIASLFVVKQLSAVIKPHSNATAPATPDAATSEPTTDTDFFEATGISQAELEEFLRAAAAKERLDSYPALLTLQNGLGDYLVQSEVLIRWNGGEQRVQVGESGIIEFMLEPKNMDGLTVVTPVDYDILRQRSIPLGTAYDPEQELDSSGLQYDVQLDRQTQETILRGLVRLQAEGGGVSSGDLQDQLRRTSCVVDLEPPLRAPLSPEEIYRRRRDCVVVIAHRYPNGQIAQASGFVLDASGVIVTNYHVMDKPSAVCHGALTSDGKMHAVKEVLAADKSGDVAIVKIDAANLPAAPLAPGEPEGATVTIISHPNSRYFSLTQGRITRYWATTSFGRATVCMGVTADFADGSSGAPCFSSEGNVVGIVSSTKDMGYQMVHRMAVPSETIRDLIRSSSDIAGNPESSISAN